MYQSACIDIEALRRKVIVRTQLHVTAAKSRGKLSEITFLGVQTVGEKSKPPILQTT